MSIEMKKHIILRFLQELLNLEAKKVEVLGKVYKQLPFEIITSKETREDVRLKISLP